MIGNPDAKLVAVAAVKNEIDVAEAFVRHTLSFVDRLIVLDNGSQDGTRAVLAALQAEGLALDVIDDPGAGKYHALRSTRLMREEAARRCQADWVVILDADEFLVVPNGALVPADADPTRPICLPWRSYVPDPSDDPAPLNPVQRLRHRLVEEATQYSKLIVPRHLALQDDAQLENGSHHIRLGENRCASVMATHAHLAHFPIRSRGQYRTKIAINYLQYQTMPDRHLGWGWQYRAPFALLKQGPPAFDASMRQAAEHYTSMAGVRTAPATLLDPLDYRGGPLRYTPALDEETRAWRSILEFAEALAWRYAATTVALEQERERGVDRQIVFISETQAHYDRRDAELRAALTDLKQRDEELARCRDELRRQQEEIAGCRLVMQQQENELSRCHEEIGEKARALAFGRAEQQRRQDDIALCRAELRKQAAELECCRRAVLSHQEGERHAGAALEAARQSWTWKAGRIVVAPLSQLKKLGRGLSQPPP